MNIFTETDFIDINTYPYRLGGFMPYDIGRT